MQATTKLEAVNSILMAAGEAPVSTIAGNNGLHVQQAISVLDEVSRRVQADGWTFNRLSQVFTLDQDNKLPVNTDIISLDVDLNQVGDLIYVIRNNFIWDMKNNTDVFTADLTLDVIVFLDWENLPMHARDYILAKSIRMYTDRTVGTSELAQFTRQDEQETWARFRRAEMQIGDYRVLDAETYRRIMNPRRI